MNGWPLCEDEGAVGEEKWAIRWFDRENLKHKVHCEADERRI